MNIAVQKPAASDGKVCGILSIVLGAISIVPFPFVGFLSPIGLILAIIALVKRQVVLGAIGLVLSLVGVATSPMLWATVGCMFTDCPQMMEDIQTTITTDPVPESTMPESTMPATGEMPATDEMPSPAGNEMTAPSETPTGSEMPAPAQ